ncbi:hypothetical protein AAFC00_007035 [Neodothiora populina]|uniref:Uncharacterized protein n=1 Tax=Neodothiora populina TaxID=2781224 RepID=A0ABR3PD83_9PEZI
MAAKAPSRLLCLLTSDLLPHHRSFHARTRRRIHAQARPAIGQDDDLMDSIQCVTSAEGAKHVIGSQDHPVLSLPKPDLDSPIALMREVLLPDLHPVQHEPDRSAPQDEQATLDLPRIPTPLTPPEGPTFPLSGDPLPHAVFRKAILEDNLGARAYRRVLRQQLLRSQLPNDILRVIAVAMQRRETAQYVPSMQESLRRAVYRARNNVSDEDILKTINVIYRRLKYASLPVPEEILKLGLKFAARSRSLQGMKCYLREYKTSGTKMSRVVFRATIAKFSIGTRGLGEIRNGRWKRDELLQVLLGFKDTPPQDAHHLGVFLQRADWQFLHGWLTALSRCRAVDDLWHEWQLWLACRERIFPRRLNIPDPNENMTTKHRGDYWFVEQMTYAGDLEKAWEMLRVTGIPFARVRARVKTRLIEGAQYAILPTHEITDELLRKYDEELRKIEDALGVEWMCGAAGGRGRGYHVPRRELEDRLEMLSEPDYVFDPEYGYPWDEEETCAKEQEKDRDIMEAEEMDDFTGW